jgi:glutamyl-tRNA synthetase
MKNNLFKKIFGFKEKIVTRIAPSPTGVLHIGTVRTALFNYLYAKKFGGKFIMRIEDTDTERSTKEFEKNIYDGLSWLGFKWDEFYKQSDRLEIYTKETKRLIDAGYAYISKEEEGDRSEVIRFKNPNKVVTFVDELRGEISFDTTELGDFVIAKSLNEPLYHLAVVIDDGLMGITHIIRGDDGISNTPRQLLIQSALGYKRPIYVHLPLILGKDKTKLSKRHGAKSIEEFKEDGFLKEAIINYIAFLGWNPGDEREFFNIEELVNNFDIKGLSKSGAVFDEEKLIWFNRHYIKNIKSNEFLNKVRENLPPEYSTELINKLEPMFRERVSVWSDISKMHKEGELSYYINEPTLNADNLIWKKSDKQKTILALEEIIKRLEENKNWDSPEEIKNVIWDFAEKEGRGDVLWPMRYALSGKEKSPDPFFIAYILDKEITLKRLHTALSMLKS